MTDLISKSIERAAEILNNGGVVGIPTETVYGLGASIFNKNALSQIFQLKKRPSSNPLIVHISNYEQLLSVVELFPEKAKKLTDAFWPGGLTIVLPKQKSINSIISAGMKTVAVRMPNHQITNELIQLTGPIAAPSANPYERISPTTANQVAAYFPIGLPLILDGGNCQKGLESTIVGFENDEAVIYRLGAVTIEDIEHIIGRVKISTTSSQNLVTPGMSKKHYAPITKTIVSHDIANIIEEFKAQKIGVLHYHHMNFSYNVTAKQLSKKQCLEEAAANLYQHLQYLDSLQLDFILIEPLPNVGLGKTINDRLNRAAHL